MEIKKEGDREGEVRKGANEGPPARLGLAAPPRRGLRWARVGAWARSCCVMQAPAGLIGSLRTAVPA